ncbi:hypothetical protein [Anaerobacillus alkaliphilus]|uniref:hypothetical protein n=1 Tax=Anaerobacillus alkaliphilus TaxID=1548597 RepID=UPI00129149D9|nr:hypothetical protein [Anaerobacillus alkaliphilus]
MAIIAVVSFLLFLLALIGYLKEIKSLLWIGITILSIYTLYLLGAVIWSFTPTDAMLFTVTVAMTLSIINILVIIKMKDQINIL